MTQRIKKWVGWFEKIDDEYAYLLVIEISIGKSKRLLIAKIKGQNEFLRL